MIIIAQNKRSNAIIVMRSLLYCLCHSANAAGFKRSAISVSVGPNNRSASLAL